MNKLRESRRRGRVEDRARRQLAFESESLDDDDLARVDELAGADGHGVIELVERLPERQRKAVRLRVLDCRDYQKIARELECSELVAGSTSATAWRDTEADGGGVSDERLLRPNQATDHAKR